MNFRETAELPNLDQSCQRCWKDTIQMRWMELQVQSLGILWSWIQDGFLVLQLDPRWLAVNYNVRDISAPQSSPS
jgi:hypothetical protein